MNDDDNRRAGEPNPKCPSCSVATGTICRPCALADACKFEALYFRALRRLDRLQQKYEGS